MVIGNMHKIIMQSKTTSLEYYEKFKEGFYFYEL